MAFFRPVLNWRLTVTNARTHWRALICDEEVAFTGGTAIDQAWTGGGIPGDWRDTAFRIRGPAVDELRGAFTTGWVQTPQPLVGPPDRFPQQEHAGDAAVQVVRPAS